MFDFFLRRLLTKASGQHHRGGPARHKAPARRRSLSLQIELLEDRVTPSTLTVANNADSGGGSLRATIASAAPGDTIVFDSSVHAIALTSGQLPISKNLTIKGPGALLLTIDGGGHSRVFDIKGSASVKISGLTIADGYEKVTVEGDGGGGILNEAGSTLVLGQDTLTNNLATTLVSGLDVLGGAVLNYGSLTIQSSSFSGNQATGGGSTTFTGGSAGGAVDSEDGTLVVTGSTFTSNETQSVAVPSGGYYSSSGGAIMSEAGIQNNNPATASITNSTFTNNLATGGTAVNGFGGAIDLQSSVQGNLGLCTMTISGSTFTGNVAQGGVNSTSGAEGDGIGGGISNTGLLTIKNSTLSGNQAIGGKGSAPSVGGYANPADGAGQGGGICNDEGILTADNVSFLGNQAIGANTTSGPGDIATGGGIDSWGIALGFGPGNLNISNSTFSGNQAIAGTGAAGTSASPLGFAAGGGIDIAFSSIATITNTTFTGNSATGSTAGAGVNGGTAIGAGICVGFSTLFSTSSQPIVDNATLQLTNSNLAGNTATAGAGGTGANEGQAFGGGLAITTGSSATVKNTTIKDNVANGGQTVLNIGQANGGGGIDNGGTLTLIGCTIKNNQAVTTAGYDTLGGGLLNNEGTATITGTTFDGNKAQGGGSADFFSGSTGGAIDNYEGATLNINDSHFNNNQAISAADANGDFFFATGGAIEEDAAVLPGNNNPSKAIITYSSFTNNLVTGGFGVVGNGGGIDIQSANAFTPGLVTMTLVGCSVTGNRSVGGGGGDEVTTGDSEGVGGGILSTKGTLIVTNCTIANNQAIGGNGAIISALDPFAGSGFGGGIGNNDSGFVSGAVNAPPTDIGSLVIANSTISGNIVRGGNTTLGPGGNAVGGGISNSPEGNMTMTDCNVIGNQAQGGTGSVTSVPGNGSGSGPGSGTVQGGFAFGGGVDTSNSGSSATIIGCFIAGNSAVGGAGSSGNVGGNGYGGGLGVGWGTFLGYPTDGSTLTLVDSYVGNNLAQGGAGGAGANGGNGEGGGLFIGPTASATVTDSRIEQNIASGGAPGIGLGDTVGNGIGGGVYNDLGTFTDDLLTILAHNLATTSNNNLYP